MMTGEAMAASGPEATEQDAHKRALAGLAAGDKSGLALLYDSFAADLFGLALWRTASREDAADVVQEVFVRLARTGARLAEVRDPRRYILQVGRRAAIDLVRRRRATEPIDEVVDAVEETAEERLHARLLAGRIRELPPEQREVVYLRHYPALTFKEIGQVTGVPTFTAASRYRLAIRRLRRLMGVER